MVSSGTRKRPSCVVKSRNASSRYRAPALKVTSMLWLLPGRSLTGSGKSRRKRRALRPVGAPQERSTVRPLAVVSMFWSVKRTLKVPPGVTLRKRHVSGASSACTATRSERVNAGGGPSPPGPMVPPRAPGDHAACGHARYALPYGANEGATCKRLGQVGPPVTCCQSQSAPCRLLCARRARRARCVEASALLAVREGHATAVGGIRAGAV